MPPAFWTWVQSNSSTFLHVMVLRVMTRTPGFYSDENSRVREWQTAIMQELIQDISDSHVHEYLPSLLQSRAEKHAGIKGDDAAVVACEEVF